MIPLATGGDETASGPREPRRTSDSASGEPAVGRGSRVASAALGAVLLVRGLRRRSLRGAATAAVGGWLLLRAVRGAGRAERELRSRTPLGSDRSDRAPADTPAVSRSITVDRPAEELYEVWRDPARLSAIMGHFAEVTAVGEDRLNWAVHGPLGRDLSWETRIAEAEPGEYLRWETPADAALPNEGAVRFRPAPGDRGTQVTLSLDFDPPGGALGDATLRRLGVVPEKLAGRALSRFKALAETGEIPTLENNPSARGAGDRL